MMIEPLRDREALHIQIATLTARQNEIFHAYASEATRAAWETGRSEREAAKAEREAAKAERDRPYYLVQGPF
jgi:hypothetical protein